MIKNIIFFFAWIGIFLLSMFGIVYIVSPEFLVSFNINTLVGNTFILTISIVYFIISLFRFITIFSRTKGYTITSSHGEVLVSTESIKSIIKETLEDDTEIKNLKISCGKKGRHYKVTLFIDMNTQRSIAEKSSEIQQKVKDELFRRLELEIQIVEIKISKVSIKNQGMN
ncbi:MULTISPECIES: alkaline shock response membrane anchor protein AmaP [Fusobacterium]|uniref:alkaline shock response membrane anchor protein AmaP n=1 Tax=Fusobacterium TaxID=848 RepID=UPI001476D2B4|nr:MULTISPECIES: alkaline shock response membrane anchor protein AmaP [Fusobacterium]NME36195.1 alkaline shock response membrane anchor protein AmaP [Fusobacterium sp. FSA-380-WT-3A]